MLFIIFSSPCQAVNELPLHAVFLADVRKTAFVTIGLCPGCTHIPAVVHQPVAEIASFLRGNDLPQRHLHLFRLFDPIYKPDPVHQADSVRVCHTSRLAENIAHARARAISSSAGKFEKRVQILRQFPSGLISQYFHAGADISRLASAEPARTDDRFDIILIRVSQRPHIRIFLIQPFNDYINTGIGTLRRQPYADQQLPCLVIIQSSSGIRIFFFQTPYYF